MIVIVLCLLLSFKLMFRVLRKYESEYINESEILRSKIDNFNISILNEISLKKNEIIEMESKLSQLITEHQSQITQLKERLKNDIQIYHPQVTIPKIMFDDLIKSILISGRIEDV